MTQKHPTPAVNSLPFEQTHKLIYKMLDRITELEDRRSQQRQLFQAPSSDKPGRAPTARQRPDVVLSLAIKAIGGNAIHTIPVRDVLLSAYGLPLLWWQGVDP